MKASQITKNSIEKKRSSLLMHIVQMKKMSMKPKVDAMMFIVDYLNFDKKFKSNCMF